MLLKVKAYPASSKQGIVKKDKDSFDVYVKEKAKGGNANKAVLLLVASYFGVSLSRVRMKRGGRQRNKIIEIIEKPGGPH